MIRATQQNSVPPKMPEALQQRESAGYGFCKQGEGTPDKGAPASREPPSAMQMGASSRAGPGKALETLAWGDATTSLLRRRNTNDSTRSMWHSWVRWRSQGEASRGATSLRSLQAQRRDRREVTAMPVSPRRAAETLVSHAYPPPLKHNYFLFPSSSEGLGPEKERKILSNFQSQPVFHPTLEPVTIPSP